MYRDASGAAKGAGLLATDVEDLLSLPLYLELFNATYPKELGGTVITEADLPPGSVLLCASSAT